MISGIKNNLNTGIQENFKQYNKNNIIRNNIGPIISKDVDGVLNYGMTKDVNSNQ